MVNLGLSSVTCTILQVAETAPGVANTQAIRILEQPAGGLSGNPIHRKSKFWIMGYCMNASGMLKFATGCGPLEELTNPVGLAA
jgi:hypothetical protein